MLDSCSAVTIIFFPTSIINADILNTLLVTPRFESGCQQSLGGWYVRTIVSPRWGLWHALAWTRVASLHLNFCQPKKGFKHSWGNWESFFKAVRTPMCVSVEVYMFRHILFGTIHVFSIFTQPFIYWRFSCGSDMYVNRALVKTHWIQYSPLYEMLHSNSSSATRFDVYLNGIVRRHLELQ